MPAPATSGRMDMSRNDPAERAPPVLLGAYLRVPAHERREAYAAGRPRMTSAISAAPAHRAPETYQAMSYEPLASRTRPAR